MSYVELNSKAVYVLRLDSPLTVFLSEQNYQAKLQLLCPSHRLSSSVPRYLFVRSPHLVTESTTLLATVFARIVGPTVEQILIFKNDIPSARNNELCALRMPCARFGRKQSIAVKCSVFGFIVKNISGRDTMRDSSILDMALREFLG